MPYTPTDLEKEIDKILAKPRGPERWRATKDLYVKFNMSTSPELTAKEECLEVAKQCAEKRSYNLNQYGKSNDKNSDLRPAIEMPTGLDLMLKLVDPELSTNDKQTKIENAMKMFKTFPEFRLCEVM